MHIGEALLPREDAIRLAAEELERALDRLAPYYAKKPELRPDPSQPLAERITADDAWIYVPFARASAGAKPLVVRVNGVTKVVVIERGL